MTKTAPMARTSEAPLLGRFQVLNTLGRGAQGEVLLAEDTRLKRRVAIKTLRPRGAQGAEAVRALLDEALIVSQLSHPGIVPLYDAGEQDGRPWLVFEYAEGETLAALLKRAGRLPPARALDIAVQVLKAVGFAHARGVVHRDLKPANVMIGPDGNARIMDFGIARLLAGTPAGTADFAGTPAYIAPETIAGQPYGPQADLFAVGMLVYEMVTGQPAIVGDSAFETLNRVVQEPFAPPSARNPELDERLDDLVLKTIAKDPAARFASAAAMEDAIYRYLSPADVSDAPAGDGNTGTLEFLLRRMRHRSDFPALSAIISAVNRAASSETERATHLSNAVLKDFALTNKILKLVNSAHYGQYKGTIHTISRAVVVMGFDNIRQIAVTLMLLEHLQNRAQATQLKDEIIAAYYSALISRDLSGLAGLRDAEEGFIGAMFHLLGRLLTAFYFHEEFQEIGRRAQRGTDEEQAAVQVLGVTYEELGTGVARAWHFPERLTGSMRQLPADKPYRPRTDEQRLRSLAALSTGMTRALREHDPAKQRAHITRLAANLGEGLGISEQQLIGAARAAAEHLATDSALADIKPAGSPLYKAIVDWARREGGAGVGTRADEDVQVALAGAVVLDTPAAPTGGAEAQAVLTAGIQDITNTLAGNFQLNDVLRMILETMYRAVGFTRVLLCVRDPASNALRGRFGFGADIDRIIKRGFSVPLAPARDVFHAAVNQAADLFIEDVDGEKIRDHVPAWYRALIPARSLLLFPVLVKGKPVGLLYADSDAGAIQLGAAELNLLKTLRNQAVLAIKQAS
jgi:serine/threonine protein kinase